MRGLTLWFVAGFLFVTAASAQSSGTDSQTMQSILREIQLLRQDLRATSVTSQRLQILVHRLEVQETAVTQATHDYNDAHSQTTELQNRLKRLNTQVERFQQEKDNTTDPTQTQRLEDITKQLKAEIEVVQGQVPDAQQKEGTAEDALRIAQQKLDELEARLDAADQELQKLSQSGAGSPQ